LRAFFFSGGKEPDLGGPPPQIPQPLFNNVSFNHGVPIRDNFPKQKRAKKKGAGPQPDFFIPGINVGLRQGRAGRAACAGSRVHPGIAQVVTWRRFLPFLWKFARFLNSARFYFAKKFHKFELCKYR
jgi:hypothetical protein